MTDAELIKEAREGWSSLRSDTDSWMVNRLADRLESRSKVTDEMVATMYAELWNGNRARQQWSDVRAALEAALGTEGT